MSGYYSRESMRRFSVTIRPDQLAAVHALIRSYEPARTCANNRPHTAMTEDGMMHVWFYLFPERIEPFRAAVALFAG